MYAVQGAGNPRMALFERVETSTRANYFFFDEDAKFSKRESELIQDYLKPHGSMPPGKSEDDPDDLF
ncbi:MAG: hypothetical protein ABIA59_11560 [Candidatus Latescibacterota bacterium]